MRIDIKGFISCKTDQCDPKLLRQPAGIICRCRLCDQHRTAHGSHFLQDFHRNTSGKDQNSILHRNFSKQAVTNHLVYSHMPADIFFVR